jgi:uncharacterized protein YidB (DUF937 family)
MSLLNSVLGAAMGEKGDGSGGSSPVVAILGNLVTQSGGLDGLMNKFSQAGMGDIFSKWVSTGPNPPVSGDQVQQALGCDQIKALAAKLGIDPDQASHILAQALPTMVDKLTPNGQIDANANVHESLSSLVPSLLGKLMGGGGAPS